MYAVILAGGGGTRLWPLSTPERPKPFLPLLPDGSTLLQRTISRIASENELSLDVGRDVFVVVDGRFGSLARSQISETFPELPLDHVLDEPEGRNTAAAVALATIAIDRNPDDVMAVLPADHLIGNGGDDRRAAEGSFRGVLAAAEGELARGALGIESPLVTLGVELSRAATEYGYLIPDLAQTQSKSLTAYVLERFEEKPDRGRAEDLLKQAGVAWNAGIFLWRRRAIRQALLSYPDAEAISRAVETGWRTDRLPEAYEAIGTRAISIDRAVLEPASREGRVVMGAMNVPWSDLGSWGALLEALGAPGIDGRVVAQGDREVVTEADLVVRRRHGRLTVGPGPGTIAGEPGPTALLGGAAVHRAIVVALVERIAAGES
ncbi:MAG: putative nucleotidyl transferase [Chloroflexi bacterium CSP1-4]|nr:MAG: putative nucleotidyl transferase [Chloroflexi bacterium CSP1-4]